MKEFDLIKRYFSEQITKRKDVILGIGDDCAILKSNEFQNIAITTDTLVSGVHFPENTSAKAIGHKAIAVNLSDLAAMGAEPAWVSLAITMPSVDEQWIKEFCEGMFELCEYTNVQLVGGDTTQGPLSVTITAQGLTPEGKYLSRSGAKAGDWIVEGSRSGEQERRARLDERYFSDNGAFSFLLLSGSYPPTDGDNFTFSTQSNIVRLTQITNSFGVPEGFDIPGHPTIYQSFDSGNSGWINTAGEVYGLIPVTNSDTVIKLNLEDWTVNIVWN